MIAEYAPVEQDFAEWNRTVSGFMRVWDIAEILGLTPCLARHLEETPHSEMAASLARKGNSRDTYMRLFLLSLRELLAVGPHSFESQSEADEEEQLHSMLNGALMRDSSPFLRLLPGYEEAEAAVRATTAHGRS